ncbi:hypothetical protein ACFXJJ_30085, partial [Streptomyces sp. NPDC059233]
MDHAKIEEIFGRCLSPYPGRFYAPSVTKNERAPFPLRSQVRCRLVPGSFEGMANPYGIETFNGHQSIDAAVGGPADELFVTYTSASGSLDRNPAQDTCPKWHARPRTAPAHCAPEPRPGRV